jgi:septum formation protein
MTMLWLSERPLVLASKSASRVALLQAAGIPVEAVPAEIDERALEEAARVKGLETTEIPAALARAKAEAVSALNPGRIVVGADQTLSLGGRAFHKPADRASAARQIDELSGQTHELHSAACIVRDGAVEFEAVQTARMTMRPLSAAMIETYLDAAGTAVLSSVGAYQLESVGIHLFERIEGDHFTILGLPLLPLLGHLRRSGRIAS